MIYPTPSTAPHTLFPASRASVQALRKASMATTLEGWVSALEAGNCFGWAAWAFSVARGAHGLTSEILKADEWVAANPGEAEWFEGGDKVANGDKVAALIIDTIRSQIWNADYEVEQARGDEKELARQRHNLCRWPTRQVDFLDEFGQTSSYPISRLQEAWLKRERLEQPQDLPAELRALADELADTIEAFILENGEWCASAYPAPYTPDDGVPNYRW